MPTAVKQLRRFVLAIHSPGRASERLKNRLAQCGQQGCRRFVDFVTVCLQRCGRVRPRPGIAVLQAIARSLTRLLNRKPFQKQRMRLRQAVGERNHHQRPVPEIFVLVVLHQPGADAAGLPTYTRGKPASDSSPSKK